MGGSAVPAILAGDGLAGAGTDTGAEGAGGAEAGPAPLELLDQEEVELLDEAEILEQETEIVDDIIGGPDDGLAGSELAGTGTDTGAEGAGGTEDGPAIDEWLADEEFELLDEAEVLEQETEIADDIIGGPADGLAGGGLAGTGTDTGAEGAGGAEDGPAIDEWLADEEFDLLDEAEVLEQETEIAGETISAPADGGLAGTGTDAGDEAARRR